MNEYLLSLIQVEGVCSHCAMLMHSADMETNDYSAREILSEVFRPEPSSRIERRRYE